ncbi:hypothetical protein [Streptomyces hydrogenans]|uniref:hypothetical protein n=1 Tax=Streptomyces hydrogenans TaxID=1873719 RepID=UPI00343EC545
MTYVFGSLLLDSEASIQIDPAFDAATRTFTVSLRRDGKTVAVHGAGGDAFKTAREAAAGTSPFLVERGIRPLTDWEECELLGGLLRLKGNSGHGPLIGQASRRA